VVDRPYLHRWDRSRYKESWLLLRPSEAQIQAAVLDCLSRRGIPALAVDAGAKRLRGRAFGALRRAGASTACLSGATGAGIAGLADIVGCLPGGRALFLECKAPEHLEPAPGGGYRQVGGAGKPSPQQLGFLDAMHGAGACVGVVWSVDDLAEVLP
jgi:hypothetical protein